MNRRIYAALGLLFCTGCASVSASHDYDWSLAVADTGERDTEITWYNDAYEVIGRQTLTGKKAAAEWDPGYRQARYDTQYAYVLPYFDQPKNPDDCGILRISLKDGSVDVLPTESFVNDSFLVTDSRIVLVQHTDDGNWYRTVMTKGGSGNTIVQDSRGGRIYYRVDGGYVAEEFAPDIRHLRLNEQFEVLNAVVYEDEREQITGRTDVWRLCNDGSAYAEGKLYVPCQREDHTFRETADGIWEPEFVGYSYGLAEIDPDTLSLTVYESKDCFFTDIVQLDETRILLIGQNRTVTLIKEENETQAQYSMEAALLILFDTQTKEFSKMKTDYTPTEAVLSRCGLYVRDTESVIHVLDPETFEESARIEHKPSASGVFTGTGTMMIVSDPKEVWP